MCNNELIKLNIITALLTLLTFFVITSIQVCDEEFSEKGISVTWQRSPLANNVLSDPHCYYNDNLITRNCTNDNWVPSLPELKPCLQVIKQYDLLACPPSFHRISEQNDEYCYQISEISQWNYPCFRSGGASLITDLSEADVLALLHSLRTKNISRFFWLPARRVKIFHPVLWHIPGPKWGWQVEANNSLRVQTSLLKNCLLLDIQQKVIITEACTKQYPSLCFYINDMHYPATCPENYHAVRFMPNDGFCYGIEKSEPNLTFDEFLQKKCPNPMGEEKNNDLTRFIFKKIAELNNLPDDVWCWFTRKYTQNMYYLHVNTSVENNLTNLTCSHSYITINKVGTLRLLNPCSLTALPCMACGTEMIYGETELLFEYSPEEQLMYLTVYFPSGLWKYNYNDRGIQCFSNAKGFVNVVDIMELPFIEVRSYDSGLNNSDAVEKTVYIINLVTDRWAQYWCEGHTQNFSLITTEKIIVNPKGNKEHVFSLVIKTYIVDDDIQNLEDIMIYLSGNITAIFDAKEAFIMDILEYSIDHLLVLFHLHVEVDDDYNSDSLNIVSTYEKLKNIAKEELVRFNYTFVNISSSLFCLPTTSIDYLVILDWEMTSIGHIAAPRQFCLQSNGLPVKRFCSGSYLLGSYWENVEGTCDKNYVASETTTFLYNFVKGQVPENYTSRFLTDGLGFVLGDVDLIIPADIYYLSMSLKHVLSIAQVNHTLVDMGDIDNMAWVMDRVLSLDCSYLRLAQTLNSTNVILDSVNDIIEILSYKKYSFNRSLQNYYGNDDTEILAVEPQCVIQISYPHENNVSGIAIINKEVADNFMEMEIKPLYKNSTIDDVLAIRNLEVAAWLPDNVLNSLKRKINDTSDEVVHYKNMYVIISVFHNDAIFQELDEHNHEVNSRIIGISIPGFILNLNTYVPLIFKNLRQSSSKKFCGYWDFEAREKENIPGSWSRRGCYLKKTIKGMTICKCYHLTHFGQLLNIGNSNKGDNMKEHTRVLNIITLIGSFLSLIGITCIWLTAFVFQTWRKKAGTKVLLHLSSSIALPLLFIVVFNLDNTIFSEENGVYVIYDHKKILCIVLGALLHYSILASFVWMLITAFLQFVRYVRVLGVRRPSRFMLKLTVIGWGVPVIPVLAVVLINKENYIPDMTTCYKCSICYPKDIYLILSVVVPVCIILLINISLFVSVLWSISKGPDGKMRTSDLDLIGAQLRLSVFLFFLLGLTWVFGIFSFSNNLIWSYLFCLTSSLQGFVLFVYFILCDPNTRNLWVTLMKPHQRPNLPRESVTSISSG